MRRRILALLFLARIELGFQLRTLTSSADNLVVAFGLDDAGFGLLISLIMAPALVLAMPAELSGRHGSDRVLTGF